MTARLFSRTGETRGSELEVDGEAIIGRDRQSDLVIDRPLMSGQHARLFFDRKDGRYVLEDLGSLNGTELDGDAVSGPERLGHLHVITFAGSYDFFFQDVERCARRHPGERPAPAEEPASAGPPPAGPSAQADESQEITAIESDPVALPGFLARRADALSDQGDAPEPPQDITMIERKPFVLPGSLAQRAEDARAEEPVEEASPPEEAAPPEPEAPSEHTIHEKLPVAMPGFLAQHADAAADAVQKHETVDLAEIEDLIASDLEAENDAGADDAATDLELIVTEPGGKVGRYPLVEGENLVGRGSGVQVALHYPDLSRRHAALRVAGGEISLRDLGSRNKTFLDDAPLTPEEDVTVQVGARLRFGSVEARLVKVGDD